MTPKAMVTGRYNLCFQAKSPSNAYKQRKSSPRECIAIITIKSTYFESSCFHLFNVHADTDEYLADDFSMPHSYVGNIANISEV